MFHPLHEDLPRVGEEVDLAGVQAAQVLAPERDVFVPEEPPHEIDVLIPHVRGQAAHHPAAAESLRHQAISLGAQVQQVVDEVLHGRDPVAGRVEHIRVALALFHGKHEVVHAAHHGDGIQQAGRDAGAQDRDDHFVLGGGVELARAGSSWPGD